MTGCKNIFFWSEIVYVFCFQRKKLSSLLQKPTLVVRMLEILEGDCFSTSILQGLGELHFTLIFIEIFKIRDSERCLYQNQNQVKNGHWNQDGSSIKFPHKFWKISSQCLLSQVPLSSLLDYFWAEKIFPESRHAAPQRFLTQKLARHCVSVRKFFWCYYLEKFGGFMICNVNFMKVKLKMVSITAKNCKYITKKYLWNFLTLVFTLHDSECFVKIQIRKHMKC